MQGTSSNPGFEKGSVENGNLAPNIHLGEYPWTQEPVDYVHGVWKNWSDLTVNNKNNKYSDALFRVRVTMLGSGRARSQHDSHISSGQEGRRPLLAFWVNSG